ncbi:hypothetical protein F0L68_39705 [Solihabitans fulvus]|uniref:Uncharacterized protein n=1 Tax=Solihabitans fulvus TaxID=1892852 RepID=A0A5B2WCQ4_9PSEU|nr:hypothetical protein [Solihabitans fulvus]KAA2248678.1 hypothetical protein F0L68_39705 [Solihabitans fulvus]
MSDEEEFSHAARLGGLRTLVIDRFVAAEAAVQVTGPPNNKDTIKPFVRYFLEWLKGADGPADRELRRRVLLMVTEGRNRQGWSDIDASKIVNLVDDVYCNIA